MIVVAVFLGFYTAPWLIACVIAWIVQRLRRRSAKTFLRRAGWLWLILLAPYLFGAFPMFVGWVGSRVVGTRGFEDGYRGPIVDPEGHWIAPPDEEREGRRPRPALDRGNTDPVFFEAEDGVRIRGFYVPPVGATRPSTAWIVVHGLFRNGYEVEPVGRMLHELGAPVLLVELRNHGGSGRSPATFGLAESRDVVAAARWLHEEHGFERVALFGVSLGSASVALATPRLADRLAGIVLDAPIDDLERVANLTIEGRFGLPWPLAGLILGALEWWSDFEMEAVSPMRELAYLEPSVPVLLIGGSEDFRVRPDDVRALFAGLPTRSTRKSMWICDGARHGKVWLTEPGEYARRLEGFLELLGD